MPRYKKRPIEIDAVQWTGLNFDELNGFCHVDGLRATMMDKLLVPTLEGVMRANRGDWIVKGVMGEIYPVRDDIFQLTYESVGNAAIPRHAV